MARGAELVGIMLDAGEHSVAAFLREVTSVLVGGLAFRGRAALGQPTPRFISDVIRFACIVIVARRLTGELASLRWGGSLGGSLTTACLMYVGPAAILALFTAGHDRATGAVGLIWMFGDILAHPRPPLSIWLEFWLLCLLGFTLMAVAPRPRTWRPRMLWVVPAIVWAAFEVTELGQHSGVGYLTPVLATVVLLPIQPAFAVGTALAWALMAAWYLSIGVAQTTRLGLALISCVLAELLVLACCRRAARRTE